MRLNYDIWALQLAEHIAQRSTCVRRAVGAVLVNTRGHILSTGYNGRHAGAPHCNETSPDGRQPWLCRGARSASGTDLDACEAIHAEQNALLQCADVYEIHTCYTTTSPCMTCVKLLLNTSCQRIVFYDAYPQPYAEQLWRAQSREWIHIPKG